ncbi:SelB C-terminal domain-containing protein [bacterium]|nr:SelB C-terminal domain-containing protein [candidate division CSSED10-310 bacterium]
MVRLDSNRYITRSSLDRLTERVTEILTAAPGLYITDIAQKMNLTRKTVSPLLHYLDSIGLTVRDGDFRKLKRKKPESFSCQ